MTGVPRKKNQTLRTRSLSLAALAVLALGLFLAAAAPLPQPQATPAPVSEIVLTLDPAQSTVHWTVDSTLHIGQCTFALESGTVPFVPETWTAGALACFCSSYGGHEHICW